MSLDSSNARYTRKIVVIKSRCPQNHPCPSVRICPVGALIQNGYDAPTIDTLNV